MNDEQPDPKQTLDGQDVEAAGLGDWRIMFDALHARFRTGDFVTGMDLVARVGAVAEEANHHPDLDLTYPHVDVRLSSHDAGGVTRRDVDLARRISDIAADLEAAADPGAVQVLELALDTADFAEIKPFWAAVLGLEGSAAFDQELTGGSGRLPTLWFQRTEAHDVPRQRFHLDIRVPPELAEARVAAAVEAGGTLVSDERAPTFWVLADAQGNQACLTTWQGRGE